MDRRCVPWKERQLSLVKVELQVLCRYCACQWEICAATWVSESGKDRIGSAVSVGENDFVLILTLHSMTYTLVPVLKSSLHGLMQLTLLPSIFILVQWWHQQSLIPHETMSWETIPHQILVTMDAHMDAFWAIVVVLLWHRNCLVNMISDNQWWMHSGGFRKTVPWCNGVEIAFQTRYYSIAMNQALKVPLLGPHHRDLRLHIFLCLFLILSLTASLSFPVIHIIPLSVFEYWI